MTYLILATVVILVIFIAVKFLQNQKQGAMGSFRSKKFLLSKAEYALYVELVPLLPPMHTVMVKVGLKDLVELGPDHFVH